MQIEAALAKMNEAWTAASQEIYNAMNSQPGGGQAPPEEANAENGSNNETVTDAEYEEVK